MQLTPVVPLQAAPAPAGALQVPPVQERPATHAALSVHEPPDATRAWHVPGQPVVIAQYDASLHSSERSQAPPSGTRPSKIPSQTSSGFAISQPSASMAATQSSTRSPWYAIVPAAIASSSAPSSESSRRAPSWAAQSAGVP